MLGDDSSVHAAARDAQVARQVVWLHPLGIEGARGGDVLRLELINVVGVRTDIGHPREDWQWVFGCGVRACVVGIAHQSAIGTLLCRVEEHIYHHACTSAAILLHFVENGLVVHIAGLIFGHQEGIELLVGLTSLVDIHLHI